MEKYKIYKMKTAVVLGGGGFIGGHLAKRLKSEGFEAIHQEGKDGADGKIIAFLHPKSTNRVLTEICSDKHATE